MRWGAEAALAAVADVERLSQLAGQSDDSGETEPHGLHSYGSTGSKLFVERTLRARTQSDMGPWVLFTGGTGLVVLPLVAAHCLG